MLLEHISDHIHVSKCVCHLCQIDTNLKVAITHPKMLQMLKELGSSVIHICRFRICNLISHVNNIFVDVCKLIY